jgi:hypothetical protein
MFYWIFEALIVGLVWYGLLMRQTVREVLDGLHDVMGERDRLLAEQSRLMKVIAAQRRALHVFHCDLDESTLA